MISILERVEHVGARHQHGEWAQRVLDLHGTRVMREHVRQPTIGLRRLIKLGRLPVGRIGRQVFIHEDALAALAQSAPRQ